MLSNSERRRALRVFKQRGVIVHVGALEKFYAAYQQTDSGNFTEFLDKAFDLLSRPDGAKDGILSKSLAETIGERLKREMSRNDGDVTASLDVIDVFTVPQWRPNAVASHKSTTGNILRNQSKPVIDASAKCKSDMFRYRYELMLTKTLRNDRFKPPLSGLSSVSKRSTFFQLTGVESLMSRKGEQLVLGMLTQLEEGTWFLEDLNGTVRLNLSQASITAGLHTDGSFVIVQGTLVENRDGSDSVFHATAMGTPPLEEREKSIDVLGNDANLFGAQFDVSNADQLLKLEKQAKDSVFLFLSDVALDNSRVLAGIRHLFQGYLQDQVVPTVIVLMGNFLSHPFGQHVNDVQTLQDGFAQLGQMIKDDFAQLAESSTFVIIPSTSDAGPGNVLPRPPLPNMIVRPFIEAIGSGNVHSATNPCRIRYMTQELVFMRDDIMQKMMRHCSIKPDFAESGLMCEHLVKSLIDQAYLCPLPLTARPILWAHHHAMWLFPTPHAVITADRVDGFICKYGGSLGLNPGSFATDFSFQVYLPAERRAQQCSLDSEDVSGVKPSSNMLNDVTNNDARESMELAKDKFDEKDDNDIGDTMIDTPDEIEKVLEVEGDRNSIDGADSGLESGDIDANRASKTMDKGEEDNMQDSEEESDDESLLVPADGVEKRDIKALVGKALVEESSPVEQ